MSPEPGQSGEAAATPDEPNDAAVADDTAQTPLGRRRFEASRRNIKPVPLTAPPPGAELVPIPVRNGSPHTGEGGYDKAPEHEPSDTSWFRGGLRDGYRGGRVSMIAVNRAMVVTAAHALRHGVEIERLDGLASWRASRDGLTITDTRASRLTDLRARAAAAQRSAATARAQAREAEDDGADDGTVKLFKADAIELTRKAAKLAQELHELETTVAAEETTDSPAGVGALHSEGALLAKALTALWAQGRMADSEQALAVRTIFEGPYMWPDGMNVHGRFSMLLPADGGVMRLGPMFFTLPNETASATELVALRMRNQASDVPGAGTLRSATVQPGRVRLGGDVTPATRSAHEMLVAAGLSSKAAWVVTFAPFPELREVLLASLNGTKLPEVADERWVAPEWRQHLLQRYTDPTFAWSRNRHTMLSWVRQMLADTCLANGGLSRRELLELLARYRFHSTVLHGLTNVAGTTKKHQGPPWLPSVQRDGNWKRCSDASQLGGVVNISCRHCGDPATLVVRSPETAEGLLCGGCEHLPRTDLVVPVPQAYRLLAMTADEWVLQADERRALADAADRAISSDDSLAGATVHVPASA